MRDELHTEDHPLYHAQRIRKSMGALIEQLREGVGKVQDAQAEALFETSAEVLEGLVKAFKHYEKRSEEAWE